MDIVHTPVLLEETIAYLAPRGDGELMVDATQGEGGHSYAFLSRFPALRLIGIDADAGIQMTARARLSGFGGRARFYNGWAQDFFAGLADSREPGAGVDAAPGMAESPDTVLIDLGVSSYHYEKSGRGFSFRKDEALDMRIGAGRGPGAAELIARLSERELADMLYRNAGERYSRRIARAIVEERGRGAIESSLALAEIVRAATPRSYGRGGMHPATRSFQAIRAAVNLELEGLPDLLEKAFAVLKPGGRLGVISFHSGEDRIVKNFFRDKSREFPASGENSSFAGTKEPIVKGEGRRVLKLLTRKPVVPGEEETRNNPPSRSAKFRAVEKLSGA
ncbi:MAG: 16S rRNA (cytosine(1402)-N(4))-methyltransferase RsmH [Spirochaetaceae bacterium]|jgi:16S rRNA (cytosine1402-N4)-methyltransferase|nr:16S rRNA (cytosine(1402)-N(4))-methyltransferase RsmH [Spirochaetaceae bacterium]